jgi:hypothetical protein
MKYHVFSCIDDALNIAAEALHDREDWADRPRILEAMAISLRGKNFDQRVMGLLYIAQRHGTLTHRKIPFLPYPKYIRESLKLLQRTELRDTPGLLLRQVQNIKDALLSPSDMMRKAGELAKITLCNTYAVREKQLEKDLAHLKSGSQDVGVTLSITFFSFDLENVRRDKQVLIEAFGDEYFL